MRFFEDESCGQCTPCRNGTEKAVKLISEKSWDAALLEELSQVMRDASICGLGQAAPNPLMRSEEHTSELQSLMRISYAVFCLKKKKSARCRADSATITK